MKISALRLFNIKRFAGRGVAIEGIGDGVNVLCAANEFGKSTSFEALHALFFQPHSGTPGAVQRLRPYSGGSPIVEADISTANGQFRITKRYYGGRSARVIDLATGRLVAQADEAENVIAGLVQGGTSGPAGLLWVRQGATGIEARTRPEEEGERQVRASLLASVQGEVEAVTGGRRMGEIIAANEAALAELVTPGGKAKAGGRYAAALARRDGLAVEEKELDGQVAALRGALDKRASATKRLAELDGEADRQERRRAVETAQSGVDRAKAQGEVLKAAEAGLLLSSERRDTAAGNLAVFRSAVGRAGEIRGKLLEAEARSRDAATKRREIADASASATAEMEAADVGERKTRDLLARLDAAMKAREAWERNAELQGRLEQAEAARRHIEDGEARLPSEILSSGDIDELQAVDLKIAQLRAVEQAARPSVTIAYEAGAADRVSLDGGLLTDREERAYDGQARLSVPGVATIMLRSNQSSRSDANLAKAEAKRRGLLASMGVDDLAAARAKQARAREIEAALREWRARLAVLAPDGLAQLRENVAKHGAVDPETLELKADPNQVRTALAAAEERRKQAGIGLRGVEPLRTLAEKAVVVAETALASLRAEFAQAEAVLGPEDGRGAREQGLSSRAAETAKGFADAQADVAGLRAAAVDPESAEAALKRARSAAEAAEREMQELGLTLAGLNAAIGARSDEAVEEKWRECVDALGAATCQVEAFEREVAVLQRLSAALERARSQARDLYLKPIVTELLPLLKLLFDDATITFDDKTLLPSAIERDGQTEDVERLSGGMREQLSVLTRLAFARLLARDGRPAPVILDDALVYSDDDRIERMFDALHRQSRDQQIIVFSCRQRAFQKLGGNILQLTDWTPHPSG